MQPQRATAAAVCPEGRARARSHAPRGGRILARELFVIWYCWHGNAAYGPPATKSSDGCLTKINRRQLTRICSQPVRPVVSRIKVKLMCRPSSEARHGVGPGVSRLDGGHRLGDGTKHSASLSAPAGWHGPGADRDVDVLSFGQSGHEVDRRCDDHDTQGKRQPRVPQRRTPDLLGLNVGVRDLKRHANGEGQVGEVSVIWGAGLVEVDPPGPGRSSRGARISA